MTARSPILTARLKNLVCEVRDVEKIPIPTTPGNEQLGYLDAVAAELAVIRAESERGGFRDAVIARKALARAIVILKALDTGFYAEVD